MAGFWLDADVNKDCTKCHVEMESVSTFSTMDHCKTSRPIQPAIDPQVPGMSFLTIESKSHDTSTTSLDRSAGVETDRQPLTALFHPCRYEDCVKYHKTGSQEAPQPADSPYHFLKSLFLGIVIGLLIIWVMIFPIFMHFNLV